MKTIEIPLDSLDLRYRELRAHRPMMEKRLTSSLCSAGQLSPVIVTPGNGFYVVIDGHKRVRALRQLKSDFVKAVVWEMPVAEALVTAYQLVSGSGWNAVEEGWLTWELVRVIGLSVSEAGRQLDRSKAWVSGRLGLVESLPEAVLAGVRSGQIGAYTATRHLLPFARANAADCERLAEKLLESGYRSREVELLCRYYGQAGRDGKQRMLEDPARFLKVMAAAKLGDACDLGPAAGRCLKNLTLLGHISLNISQSLAEAAGNEACERTRLRLKAAWTQTRDRWLLLEKAAAGVFGIQPESVLIEQEEADNAEQSNADSNFGFVNERAQPARDHAGA